MPLQWLVSIAAGAIGGFFDGLFSQHGLYLPTKRQDEAGHEFYDLGIIEHVLTGALAGLAAYALNSGTATFDAPALLGPTVFSTLTGLAGSEFVKRMRDNRQLAETSRTMGQSAERAADVVRELESGSSQEEQP
jgi:hypothetical protein